VIRRLLRRRGVRKFMRDRLAMFALAVISLYLGAALVIWAGSISEDETRERVGPDNLVGFYEEPSHEQRLEYVEFYLDKIDSAAADRRSPEKRLAAIGPFAGMKPLEKSVDDWFEALDPLWAVWEELDEAKRNEAFDEEPSNYERLAELEAGTLALYQLDGEPPADLHYAPALWLGTDRQGRSILRRGLYSILVAVKIGLVAALVSVLIGTILGGAAGFFGGWVDHLIVWLYSTFSAIPYIVLLMVMASMFIGSSVDGTLIPVYAAFCLTFWIGPCRVIRGEVLKLRELEYVQAATALGFGRMRILLKHVVPNTAHLMFINFSLLFIGAIKAEVILSFLGLGVKNEPSWGVMIQQARQEVLNGFFWQIGAATALMFVLVLAFNVVSDALQDAFDPKHVG